MKLLTVKRKDRKTTTTYRLTVGSAEARLAGFLKADGTSMQLTKMVEPGRIVFEVVDNEVPTTQTTNNRA